MQTNSPISKPGLYLVRLLLLCIIFLSLSSALPEQEPPSFRALLFTKTGGFRHASIPSGIAAVQALATENGFSVDATEDASVFNEATLSQYQVVIFLNTTGDVLTADQQAAFEAYIQAGNGFAGIHSAADTEYDWEFYGELVGAYFESHPAVQSGTIKVADRIHPSTAHLPARWERTDEWYNYQANPRGNVHILATLEESSYGGGNMGHDHPISWCQTYQGGRSWYTGLGHTAQTFEEPLYLQHILQGIRYAAGVIGGDCTATVDAYFDKAILDDNTNNPMHLDIAPDGRVFFVERSGTLKIYDPEERATTIAASLDVTTAFEDGLLGVVLDPDFEDNNWVYLFYSPRIGGAKQHVSRFTLEDDLLNLDSEVVLLEIPVQRVQCCHSGGSLLFDRDGNLYIATGDNTNPFESDGFTPIDERPNRAPWDARGTSGNANDLRGKILRIIPQDDGTYTIPEGNLFPDGENGLPEIYVMGVRNPFRMGIDLERGWLYWGDVGPDAFNPSPLRGPRGFDEFNQARSAGNFGWPFCSGDNEPYVDYDFESGQSSGAFDCDAPVNTSVNNTGATTLPPARPAWIWYPYGPSNEFPQLPNSQGRTAMGGPVYQYDETLDSDRKLPAYFDDTVFIYEWARNWVLEVKLDDEGEVLEINPFIPNIKLERPIAMELGPDGALYILEWGTGFGGNNNNSQLVRIDFIRGNRAPVAFLEATPRTGPAPLTVSFSSEGSFDPDPGDRVDVAWDFDGDGNVDSTEPNPTFTYEENGGFSATLIVTDQSGNSTRASALITVGNTPPIVSIESPVNGGFFDWGALIPFAFTVSDAEEGSTLDGTIDCDTVVFQPFVGHDDHSHPLDQYNACEGLFPIIDAHGSDGDNLFYIVDASYTDKGVENAPGLTTTSTHILHPLRIQAEHFTTNNGTMIEQSGDFLGGGQNVGFIEDGDHISFAPINLSGIEFIRYRVASAGPGGIIEARVDAPDGPVISFTSVEPTGDWQQYRDVTAAIEDPGGTHELFFVFTNFQGATGLFNINWIDFIGSGIALTDEETPGLFARYYNNTTFMGPATERIDPNLNFNWGRRAPVASIDQSSYSVRWSGFLEPEFGGSYRFHTQSGSAMQVWLDNRLILDHQTTAESNETTSESIQLEAEQAYPIQIDYVHNGGASQVNLLWSNSSRRISRVLIPREAFVPDSAQVVTTSVDTPQTQEEGGLFPNPVRSRATLTFHLPAAEHTRITVYDVLGRQKKTLVDRPMSSGVHTTTVDADGLPAGAYFYVIESGDHRMTEKFVVIR